MRRGVATVAFLFHDPASKDQSRRRRDGHAHTTADADFDTVALDAPGFLRQLVERALQRFLEAEMTAHLGAARYGRSEGRHGHRNGYKPRPLHWLIA